MLLIALAALGVTWVAWRGFRARERATALAHAGGT
jgi:hypothetical protein